MASTDDPGQASEREVISTPSAPPPAGTYSPAIRARGFLFVSGQTPRYVSGERALDLPFDQQARLTLGNLEEVARAGGSSLRNAVHVTVFLKDPSRASQFDEVYRSFVPMDLAPARTVVQSDLAIGELEINAILLAG